MFCSWYYSTEEKTCIPFVFGGCAGNLNRFKSFDTCINFCEKALGYTYRERPVEPTQGTGVRSGDGGGVDPTVGSQQDPQRSYNYCEGVVGFFARLCTMHLHSI